METTQAVKRLSALAQRGRIEAFRLLVKAGPDGVAAGEIARRLGIPQNTLSTQLLVLSNAQLVTARREGRSIIYSANFESMRDLLVFLTRDCCGGNRDVCLPLAEIAAESLRCAPTAGARK